MKKGYQKTGPITGTITTKLKGASFYNGSHGDFSVNCEGLGEVERTFDVGDYVIPPQVCSHMHECTIHSTRGEIITLIVSID